MLAKKYRPRCRNRQNLSTSEKISALPNSVCGVHRAGAANRTSHFGAVQRFVDDLANGAGTTATLGTAAEATIDVARGAARRSTGGGSHFMVAQYVAGTDDHRTPCWGYSLTGALPRVKIKLLFKNVLNYCLESTFCCFRSQDPVAPALFSKGPASAPFDGLGNGDSPPRHVGMQPLDHAATN